jgi:hypothetical protein
VFDNLPPSPTYNLPSWGYQATQTAEFGPYVQLGGTARNLNTITVGMSNWARESTYQTVGTSPGYYHNLTLNLYGAPSGTTPGALIATKTVSAFIPWRPESAPNTPWQAPDGNLYNGLYFTVDFDFSADGIVLPESLILGLAYNTQTWGESPIGIAGPYNSLNFAVGGALVPTVGSLPNPDAVFLNTSTAGWYADNGAAGVGIFREDTAWAGFIPTVQITADLVPEPMSLVIWSVLGVVAGTTVWRRNRVQNS